MTDLGRYDQIVAALYGTAADPTSWLPTLESLRDMFGCTAVALQTTDRRTVGSVSTLPELSAVYLRDWSRENPIFTGRMAQGTVAVDQQIIDRRVLKTTAYYNEFLVPAEISRMVFVQGLNNKDGVVALNLLRSHRRPDFDDSELRLVSRLSQHLTNALQTASMLGWRHWSSLIDSLETAAEAMIVLDRDGNLLHLNPVARDLAEVRDGIVVSGRRLGAARSGDQTRLRQAIWAATAGPSPRIGTMLAIERPSGARPLIASISPLPEQTLDFGIPNPCAIVAILDPARQVTSPAIDLHRLFGLTRREADIARALGKGLTIAEAAAHCGVTLVTARNYLARVLRKTDVGRQGELVLLLHRLASLASPRGLP